MKSDQRHIGKFSLPLGTYLLKNPAANGKLGLLPKEMSWTLLTNKKQGKNYQVHATHIINTPLFRIYQEIYVSLWKIGWKFKNLPPTVNWA